MTASALLDLDTIDIEALKALYVAQRSALSESRQLVEHQQLMIDKLRMMLFGRKSEKLVLQIEQMELHLEEDETELAAAEQKPPVIAAARDKNKPARKPLPAHLPRSSWNTSQMADAARSAVEHCACSAKMWPRASTMFRRTSRLRAMCVPSMFAMPARKWCRLLHHRARSLADWLDQD